MAADAKEKEGSSTLVILISALLALGAAGGVYYFYDQAQTSENALQRSKDEYKKMAAGKKAVEEYIRQRKGRPAAGPETNEDLMTFLDKKAREAQIPQGSFTVTKNADMNLTAWKESSYTMLFQGGKDVSVKKLHIVELLRRVEAERRSVKVKSLQLAMSGDDFKSASITFSQFSPKQ
jgi:type II secretory pathway component PulJ